jgi:hypothetical protein
MVNDGLNKGVKASGFIEKGRFLAFCPLTFSRAKILFTP